MRLRYIHAYRNTRYELVDDTSNFYNQNAIIDLSKNRKTLEPKYFGTLSKNSTLYFDKSAVFPRYKLENSGYKRCIKKEKCDFVIVGKNISPPGLTHIQVFETPEYLLFFDNYYRNTSDLIKTLNDGGIYDAKLIYNDDAYMYTPQNQILLDTNPTKPYIYDSDLDMTINNQFSEITESDIKQILSMLESKDSSIVNLGLKTLASFNITKTPMTVKTILLINNNWIDKYTKSVCVQTMFDSLNLSNCCFSYGLRYRLGWLTKTDVPYSNEDKALANTILKDCIQTLLENEIQPYKTIFEDHALNYKITINVEG